MESVSVNTNNNDSINGIVNVITPSPTPIPRAIFIPRKSLSPASEDDDDDEDESTSNNFDATNLFGGSVITSEPRRSDAFVLFAAGSSSSEEEEESECEITPVTNNTLSKCSSIVSLQAAPSSELTSSDSSDSNSNDSDSDSNESFASLPQSVTLRRLSSVSPIPEPSEIPSLHELKESLVRAPTPSQIIQTTAPKSPKKRNYYKNAQRGRPTKKQLNGRPSKN